MLAFADDACAARLWLCVGGLEALPVDPNGAPMTDINIYMYTNITERARWLMGRAMDEGSKAASGISG
ncbi:MAG: hypothetical protein AAF511_09960 [Pseudomonadota bacterium]